MVCLGHFSKQLLPRFFPQLQKNLTHFCVESENVKLIETEQNGGWQALAGGENGEILVKGYKLSGMR